MRLAPVDLDFTYKETFGSHPRTGYETLIYDALIGDATLFQRADTIELGWEIVQPFLDVWGRGEAPLETYAPGSGGPSSADELLARSGRHWHALPAVGSAKEPPKAAKAGTDAHA
jgi:glucose-6-phosphate 1-dehydrogenase